ncbi:MAG TPA: hypothetical protein VHM90_08595, partial [Phycisphaerae bacterium]|nr:hypothetical protein [Phycisphaerae bacterium]
MTIRSCVAALIACCGSTAMGAEIVVRADKPGPAVSPTLYGAFFEDINRAGDGGIYGEMLQNRSFEDATVPLGWTLRNEGDPAAEMKLAKDAPINPRNPTQLKVTVTKAGAGVVVFNEGFKGTSLQGKAPTDAAVAKWVADSAAAARRSTEGLHIQDGKEYDLSIYLRSDKIGMVQFTLEQANGRDLASGVATGVTDQWKKFDVKIVARGADSNARFTINLDSPGTLWIDMASLFPRDTFKNRPNGMRADLVQMMADMHPGLLRFPGGSFSEGAVLADAWRWKETIGDIAQRGSNWNIWGYRTSNGIGFHEYLQLAEDLHAAPLFVAHVGMA